MRRTLAALMMCIVAIPVMSQGPRSHQQQSHGRQTVSFESSGGESFSVFIDGTLVNRMPQSRVMVDDLDGSRHEVVVVLRRPAQKAAVMQLQPSGRATVVDVRYDQRRDVLTLGSLAEGRGATRPHPAPQGGAVPQPPVAHHPAVQPPVQPAAPAATGVSNEQLAGMVARLKSQPFDNDRLAMGKVIVASSNLTSLQIARLAETMEFASSRVDFLKYAYHYCVDPVNYYKTTDVLTFSSDKKRILDYIATQK